MTNSHPVRSAVLGLIGAFAVAATLHSIGCIGKASAADSGNAPGLVTGGDTHALPAVAPTPVPTPVPSEVPPASLNLHDLMLFLVTMLSSVALGMHFIAPRTKNTVDDRVSAFMDSVLALIRPLAALPTATPEPVKVASVAIDASTVHDAMKSAKGEKIIMDVLARNQVVAPVKTPEAGRTVMSMLLAIVVSGTLIGTGIGLLAADSGCATVRPAASAGASAGIDCEAPNIVKALADLLPLAKSAVKRWISGTGTIDAQGLVADMKLIKSDLGRCAMTAAIAAVSEAPATMPGVVDAAPMVIDGTQVRAAFTAARILADWAPIRLPSGEVL